MSDIELIRNKPGSIQRFVFEGKPGTKQAMRVAPVFGKDKKVITKPTKSGRESVVLRQFQDKETINNTNFIKWCIKGQLPFGWELWDSPIIVRSLQYVFYPPKALVKRVQAGETIYVSTKPDLTDNLNKLLFDAMNQVVYTDDARIVHLCDCSKIYGLQPRTVIILEKI